MQASKTAARTPDQPWTSFGTGRWKIHQFAGLGVFPGCRHHFMQLPSKLGVLGHLAIPIIVRPGVQQRLQLAPLLRGKLVNGSLDFSNRAHVP